MAKIKLLLAFFCLSVAVSCIKSEPLNAEADILDFTLADPTLIRDVTVGNNSIEMYVTDETRFVDDGEDDIEVPKVDITKLAPIIKVTNGATISPKSGTTLDFTHPQQYTVISQDGAWSKVYMVYVVRGQELDTHFSFDDRNFKLENYSKDYAYPIVRNYDSKGNFSSLWSSGNIGYSNTGEAKDNWDYPTTKEENGYKGQALKLQTKSGGPLGNIVGAPIAAGNLFLGKFNNNDSFNNVKNGHAAKSVELGYPFTKVPVGIKGYYKYKSGEKYTEGKTEKPGVKDQWDAYIIFYLADGAQWPIVTALDRFTNPKIIGIGKLDESISKIETDTWTPFEIKMQFANNYNLDSIDPQKLKAGKYNISVVFTSSKYGDLFSGAIGSTLLIDEVDILTK